MHLTTADIGNAAGSGAASGSAAGDVTRILASYQPPQPPPWLAARLDLALAAEAAGTAADTPGPAAGAHRAGGPRWRALLEARWQDRLRKVTELSLAFHDAAASTGPHRPEASLGRLMRRVTAARRDLAATEAALSRLSGGSFGRCERCSAPIPAAQLIAVPEDTYCQGCA